MHKILSLYEKGSKTSLAIVITEKLNWRKCWHTTSVLMKIQCNHCAYLLRNSKTMLVMKILIAINDRRKSIKCSDLLSRRGHGQWFNCIFHLSLIIACYKSLTRQFL